MISDDFIINKSLKIKAGITWADIKSKVSNPIKSGKTFKGWAVKD